MSDSTPTGTCDTGLAETAPLDARVGTLRILIAEDHTVLSEGLRALLSKEPDIEVVGIVENGHEAVAAVVRLSPDLVLMDLSMPELDGLSAIREIGRRQIVAKILVLTAHKTEEHIRAALLAGAQGYVLKDSPYVELLIAIRSVAGGKTYISPEISGCIVSSDHDGGRQSVFRTPSETLSGREAQVLRYVVRGLRNREIAHGLGISIKTVEKHRASVMHKLKLANAAELTLFARKNGFMDGG